MVDLLSEHGLLNEQTSRALRLPAAFHRAGFADSVEVVNSRCPLPSPARWNLHHESHGLSSTELLFGTLSVQRHALSGAQANAQ